MYTNPWEATQRQHDLLSQARRERQAVRARALRKAGRRASRAERRLVQARSEMAQLRTELDSEY